MEAIRTVSFYKTYFQDFFDSLPLKVKKKFAWTFDLICLLKIVPEEYLKHITGTDGLFEVRVQVGSDIYRAFCFFEKGNLVVIANGFQKKSQKTPKNEIEKALKIKAEYESETSRK
jgi:phage-related protein